MKSGRSLIYFLLVLISANAIADTGLCKTNEINFSSCEIGEKIASFCASRDLTATSGYFQYRFGTLQKVELTYPTAQRPPTGLFFRSMSPDGLENRISFRNGSYIYMYFGIDSPHGASFGIHIVNDGKLLKTLECTGQFSDQNPVPYELMKMEEFVWFKR